VKRKDIRNLTEKDRLAKINELRKNLMKLGSQRAVGTTSKNPLEIKKAKKTLARLLTPRVKK